MKPSFGAGTNLPSVNFRMFATDEYSYLIGLDQVTWHDALTRCPRYGDGYYLANIDSGEEFELLRNYFRGLSIAGALCCLKYFILTLSLPCKYLSLVMTFQNFLLKEHFTGAWLSGTDEKHEGCWVWATPNISEIDGRYWFSNEPNNA